MSDQESDQESLKKLKQDSEAEYQKVISVVSFDRSRRRARLSDLVESDASLAGSDTNPAGADTDLVGPDANSGPNANPAGSDNYSKPDTNSARLDASSEPGADTELGAEAGQPNAEDAPEVKTEVEPEIKAEVEPDAEANSGEPPDAVSRPESVAIDAPKSTNKPPKSKSWWQTLLRNRLAAWKRKRLKPKTKISQGQLSIELFKERVSEQKQRRHFRVTMFCCFFLLLLVQHAGIVVLLVFAVMQGFIDKAQPLLSIIIPTTLLETYKIIEIMVRFVFSPGDFGENKNIQKNNG